MHVFGSLVSDEGLCSIVLLNILWKLKFYKGWLYR